jgi:hypothetical protein
MFSASAISSEMTSSMTPPATSATGASLSAPAVPTSFSLLPPRLAALLSSLAQTLPPATSSYAAIATQSVGIYSSSTPPAVSRLTASPPEAPAPPAPPAPYAPPPATNAVAIHHDSTAGGAGAAPMDNLATLTAAYGARPPLSGYPAYGPRFDAGPSPFDTRFDAGPSTLDARLSTPVREPLQYTAPIGHLGPT